MTSMVVITPSFAPDFELCADLNRSVMDNAPATVHHEIIVPRADLELFRRLAGPRTHVLCESEFLPRSFVRLPRARYTLDLGHPFPPVRGWILQQIVKLSAVAACTADVALLVDSDVEFIRSFGPDTFVRDGVVRFYRVPREIDDRLPLHMIWHRVARELLRLPPAEPPYTDYISSLMAWDPVLVRQMLARVEATARRTWPSAIAGQLHFSEWTLYGMFLDHVAGASATSFSSDRSLCHAHWSTVPLGASSAVDFFRRIRPTDVAAMISAKSRTPLAIKRAAFREYRAAMYRLEPS